MSITFEQIKAVKFLADELDFDYDKAIALLEEEQKDWAPNDNYEEATLERFAHLVEHKDTTIVVEDYVDVYSMGDEWLRPFELAVILDDDTAIEKVLSKKLEYGKTELASGSPYTRKSLARDIESLQAFLNRDVSVMGEWAIKLLGGYFSDLNGPTLVNHGVTLHCSGVAGPSGVDVDSYYGMVLSKVVEYCFRGLTHDEVVSCCNEINEATLDTGIALAHERIASGIRVAISEDYGDEFIEKAALEINLI